MPALSVTEAAQMLRSSGLRVTAPRVAVLEALSAEPHTSAEELTRAVRHELGAVSIQTVYDVLGALTESGLARRIEPAGRPALFETRTGDNHHHIVCRECGRTEDVDCAVGDVPCLTASDDHGFEIDEAEVTFWGLCPRCHERTKTTAHNNT